MDHRHPQTHHRTMSQRPGARGCTRPTHPHGNRHDAKHADGCCRLRCACAPLSRHADTLTHTLSHTRSLSLSLSLTHTQTHTLTVTHTHTLTHTHTHTHSHTHTHTPAGRLLPGGFCRVASAGRLLPSGFCRAASAGRLLPGGFCRKAWPALVSRKKLNQNKLSR